LKKGLGLGEKEGRERKGRQEKKKEEGVKLQQKKSNEKGEPFVRGNEKLREKCKRNGVLDGERNREMKLRKNLACGVDLSAKKSTTEGERKLQKKRGTERTAQIGDQLFTEQRRGCLSAILRDRKKSGEGPGIEVEGETGQTELGTRPCNGAKAEDKRPDRNRREKRRPPQG